jgi:hypothetical protein
LLLESDGGWKTVDAVNFRNTHLIEEPPGIRGDGFEITPLSFRVKCPESKRGLARSGYTRENDQRITRYFDINVL